GVDVGVEVGVDVGVEVGVDVGVEVGVDVGVEVGVDSPSKTRLSKRIAERPFERHTTDKSPLGAPEI
ncbi:hypothetical protein, partial [Haloplanus vescus]|uniref:hypothetical protein n=1 Tax=Haloplanus vescus TaxID=555874 RepID=UPI001FDFF1D8